MKNNIVIYSFWDRKLEVTESKIKPRTLWLENKPLSISSLIFLPPHLAVSLVHVYFTVMLFVYSFVCWSILLPITLLLENTFQQHFVNLDMLMGINYFIWTTNLSTLAIYLNHQFALHQPIQASNKLLLHLRKQTRHHHKPHWHHNKLPNWMCQTEKEIFLSLLIKVSISNWAMNVSCVKFG